MKFTCQSEYLPLHEVIINPVAHAFLSESKVIAEWRTLNFSEQPDFRMALEEYGKFQQLLKDKSPSVITMPEDKSLSLDALYCRDASIATDHGMILCRMGKLGRKAEPEAHRKFYKATNIPILGSIEAPGTLEGGDVAWLDRTTLAVGHTYRTNRSGIDQLKALLNPLGIDVIVAELPHFRGPADVFHLMSVLSPVDKNLAVIYSPLMPIAFRDELLERGYAFVEVPEKEYDSLGCNVLATGPRQCIMVEGNPLTEQGLIKAGCEVTTYKGIEISVKGGGGPTCLTRPFRREL